jgi:hypothetical protein
MVKNTKMNKPIIDLVVLYKTCACYAMDKTNELHKLKENYEKLKTITILSKLIDLANRCGIRHKGVPIDHGFRKFFTTQLINSKVNP